MRFRELSISASLRYRTFGRASLRSSALRAERLQIARTSKSGPTGATRLLGSWRDGRGVGREDMGKGGEDPPTHPSPNQEV